LIVSVSTECALTRPSAPARWTSGPVRTRHRSTVTRKAVAPHSRMTRARLNRSYSADLSNFL
jgi:hypothetical protein